MDRSWEEYDFQDSRFKHSKNSMQSMNSLNSREVSPIAGVSQSKLSGNHKEVIRQEIYLRFETQCLLDKLVEWVQATQQLRALPSYLRLLLDDYQLIHRQTL